MKVEVQSSPAARILSIIQFSLFQMSHLVVVYQIHTDILVKSWGDAVLASCIVIIGHVRPALISVIFVMLCDDEL